MDPLTSFLVADLVRERQAAIAQDADAVRFRAAHPRPSRPPTRPGARVRAS